MLDYSDLEPDQHDAIDFIGAGEDGLLCADVGTGKTVISLTAAKRALETGSVSRWLVAAPLLVANDAWANECAEWSHLNDLPVALAVGNKDKRLAALAEDAPITVTNYENLPWLMEHYPRERGKDQLPFDGLICDEIDKLKSVGTNRFKNFRSRLPNFEKRIGLTGTLLPTRLEEVWGQAFIVDGGQSFGRSFYKWRQKYFYPTDYKQHSWAPFAHTREYIIETLADITYRLKAQGLPQQVVHEPNKLDLPKSVCKTYGQLERHAYAALGSGREVTAGNAGVLVGKLQQICAGFSYVDEDIVGGRALAGKRRQPPVWHSHDKLNWLHDTITNQSEQFLTFYHYTAELNELQKRYFHKGDFAYIGGGQTPKRSGEIIKAWNRGDIGLLALHPMSAGHGLNLQKSHAHNIAFLTMPWSGGMWKQVVGRLARRGNREKFINVFTSLYTDTIDEVVFDVVTARVNEMESFLDAIEAVRN